MNNLNVDYILGILGRFKESDDYSRLCSLVEDSELFSIIEPVSDIEFLHEIRIEICLSTLEDIEYYMYNRTSIPFLQITLVCSIGYLSKYQSLSGSIFRDVLYYQIVDTEVSEREIDIYYSICNNLYYKKNIVYDKSCITWFYNQHILSNDSFDVFKLVFFKKLGIIDESGDSKYSVYVKLPNEFKSLFVDILLESGYIINDIRFEFNSDLFDLSDNTKLNLSNMQYISEKCRSLGVTFNIKPYFILTKQNSNLLKFKNKNLLMKYIQDCFTQDVVYKKEEYAIH